MRQLFQHLRRNINAGCAQMLCGLGEMSLAFARTHRRHSVMGFLTARFFTAFALRIPAMMLPHFPGMMFEALGLLMLSVTAKLLEPVPEPVGHRATGRRAVWPRLAGSFGSRRPGEDQGGEEGNEDACFHRSA
ncbi:MAG: hypothetical protein ABI318_23315 [Chthoniobacteraceae bacterium]